jgi:Ca2+-binding EF-hand superfamily protein
VFHKEMSWFLAVLVAVIVGAGVSMGPAMAQKATPKTTDKAALAESEVKQLLLLIDTDKNGKISKQEFMNFMQAEFDRLDTDKSGELDTKELAQSQLRVSRPAVGK